MELTKEMIKKLQEDLKNAKSYQDLMGENGAIKKLLKSSIEMMLNTELDEHLGYAKHSPAGNNTGNSRNGKTSKSLKTEQGELDISVPRDRNGSFDPVLVKKYKRTLGPMEDIIIAMYARGMTTRDIQAHVKEIYGIEISPSLVSSITDGIIEIAKQWHNRPLESVYPIVFFDAIFYKVHDEGRVVTKAAYTALSIDLQGKKDLLGIWVSESESSAFWLRVFTELHNRGVNDILIAVVDGLKGFPESIRTLFPYADVQQCVIHMIRNSIKYLPWKLREAFVNDLKKIYGAPTEESALMELDNLETKWSEKFSIAVRKWRNNWDTLSTFFKYPTEVRKIIYTTNAVESVHRQFRKVTKTKVIFPHDDALKKMLYLAYRDLHKKWDTRQIKQWSVVLSYLSVIFKERLKNAF